MEEIETIIQQTSLFLSAVGLEIHTFKIGWYNDHVDEPFKLPYPYDTLAICIVSTPEMFDKGFKPFLKSGNYCGSMDPLDEFISGYLNKLKTEIPNEEMEIIFDYELLPSRRPKILVQTAGHVSGAAFYYRREKVKNDPWGANTKIYGVSIHKKYGGWFGFRGVIVFRNIQAPELKQQLPVDVVCEDEKVIELLEKFNYHWKDWSYRDIIPVIMKYSEEQKLYFNTAPAERRKIIEQFINTGYKQRECSQRKGSNDTEKGREQIEKLNSCRRELEECKKELEKY